MKQPEPFVSRKSPSSVCKAGPVCSLGTAGLHGWAHSADTGARISDTYKGSRPPGHVGSPLPPPREGALGPGVLAAWVRTLSKDSDSSFMSF